MYQDETAMWLAKKDRAASSSCRLPQSPFSFLVLLLPICTVF